MNLSFLYHARLFWLLAILNLLDGGLTLFWIGFGYANEANPLMAYLWSNSPELFIFVKFGLVTGFIAFLCVHRERRQVLYTTVGLSIVYLAVVGWHILNAIRIF
jgi:hypothetical protein